LLDVADVAGHTGATIITAPTGCFLARSMGAPADHCLPVMPGDEKALMAARVRVLAAEHPPLFRCSGQPPFPGKLESVPEKPPAKPSDWVCGTPLAFVIEMGGKRIYVDSGGTPEVLPPADAGPVDVAILGVALGCARERFVEAAKRLRPGFIIPSHQDDLFRPLDDGFHFGRGSSFPAVRRDHEKHQLPGRLVLLDYFRPWTVK
jgi:L-ascorbate metabolism protein UlaG (beta-lactamase superfamily)